MIITITFLIAIAGCIAFFGFLAYLVNVAYGGRASKDYNGNVPKACLAVFVICVILLHLLPHTESWQRQVQEYQNQESIESVDTSNQEFEASSSAGVSEVYTLPDGTKIVIINGEAFELK